MVLHSFSVSDKDSKLLNDTYNKLKGQCDQLPPEIVKKLLSVMGLESTSLDSFEEFSGYLVMNSVKDFLKFSENMKK
jgi:hypothetical protein